MNDEVKKILLEINQFCNLNCKYCFYNDIGRSKEFIDNKGVKNILKKFKNVEEVFLTGGEITLNKDFDKIVQTLSKKTQVSLFTNAILFNDYEESKLVDLTNNIKAYIITFDSINENYKLRIGKENQVISAIKRLVNIDPEKVIVKICLNKMNIIDFEETIIKLLDIGVKHLSLNYIKNIRSSNINFELTDEEVIKSFDIINKYKEYFNKENIEFIMNSYIKKFKNKTKCIAGINFIFIDCFGNEFYCPSSNKKFDNKKDNNCFGKHCVCIWEMFNERI
jgi:MoaA/NifB/PqqE/SkfB family radical SAM enzyme